MSSLRLDEITVPTAPLGPENPLPPLADGRKRVSLGDGVSAEMRQRIGYGAVPNVFPYLTQDGYARERADQSLRVAVLDNGVLRATFLLDYGGRLWSLVHQPTGRELLFRNRVLQPANLALRNAWFSGGVEWNLGTTGHTATTCAPLHAVRVERPGGVPVLRMYEWERMRGLGFQVDAWLPEGSPLLHVYVRVRNPGTVDAPVYWWSNIAVPEADDVRVLAPADAAFHLGYDGTLRRVPMPVHDAVDRTYTTRSVGAADHFFDLPDGARPWIAALDASGTGLVQASTSRLRGRKLFCWGTGRGGRHWQEWLNGDADARYLEIQAGLASTQLEHLRLPAGEDWSWLEVYGHASADASLVHGEDWPAATAEVSWMLETLAPAAAVTEAASTAAETADTPPAEVLHRGSGWGALEQERRRAAGEAPLSWPGTPFTADHLDATQAPWRTLLTEGALPEPAQWPVSYVVGADWEGRLAAAPETWQTRLHLGLLAHNRGDADAARGHYDASLALARTPWALRALGHLELSTGAAQRASDLYADAHALRPHVLPLSLETAAAHLTADRPAAALAVVDALPAEHRTRGRTRYLETAAAIAAGDVERAGAVLSAGLILPDVREGETSLGHLWHQYQRAAGTAEPLPYAYDFQMTPDH